MNNRKEQRSFELIDIDEQQAHFESTHRWLFLSEEEDDFLFGKVPAMLPDFTSQEEEE